MNLKIFPTEVVRIEILNSLIIILNYFVLGGDLRAQISRKRAEKQKLPISENFKSRLLQNALEEVVYKQKSKRLKSKLDTKGISLVRI